MKKIIICVLSTLLCQYAMAQYKSQYRIQYGNVYGVGTNLFGLDFVGEYLPIDDFSIAPSFSVLFPETGKASSFHLDGRYYLTDGEVEWYGLLGYGYYRRRLEFDFENDLRTTRTLNIGGGILYKLVDELGINGEIKFQPQNNGEFIIKIGMTYFIN